MPALKTGQWKNHKKIMPTRVVREGINSSERVNALTERAELFYRKLMNVLDDHGRFFSNPVSILGACYPMRPTVTIEDVNRWLSECEACQLLMFYRDRKYIQVFDFRQQIRRASKFPELTENELLIKSKAESKQNPSLGVGVGVGVGVLTDKPTHTLPESNLPTWNEIKSYAEMHAIKPESAKSFFDHHEGNLLWINQHGRLINWQHKIVTWAATDRAKPDTVAAKPASKMTHKEILAQCT